MWYFDVTYNIVSYETTLYYHNYNWQVLKEADANEDTLRLFVYGNYIDEPLLMHNFDDIESLISGNLVALYANWKDLKCPAKLDLW